VMQQDRGSASFNARAPAQAGNAWLQPRVKLACIHVRVNRDQPSPGSRIQAP
jgi:hypothetical protein